MKITIILFQIKHTYYKFCFVAKHCLAVIKIDKKIKSAQNLSYVYSAL